MASSGLPAVRDRVAHDLCRPAYLGSWVALYLVELLPNLQAGRQKVDQVLRSVTTLNMMKSDSVER